MRNSRSCAWNKAITFAPHALFCALLFILPLNGFSQFVQQGNKLTAADAIRVGLQGTSVAVSADGKTAVVGGPYDGYTGAAWVYTENNGVWTQQGPKLIGSDAVTLSSQGNSVAISADGNTIIIGGPDDNDLTGAAWVFTRTAGVWTQQGPKLVGTGGIGQTAQGVSVALSADGNTAIIGASNDNGFKGAAWIFTRNNGVWTQQSQKLVGAGAIGYATQGYAVGMSADGNTVIIGGPNDNSYRGAAWIFKRNGNLWTQQGPKIVGSGASYQAIMATSVALSGDGNTAIIGGKHDSNYRGSAWIFVRNGNAWVQQGSKIFGTGVSGYSFQGFSVDLSFDGNTAILGGYGDNDSKGAAWVFVRNGVTWSQQGSKLVGTGISGDYAGQGTAVSLSDNGNLALIGGPNDNLSCGAAWVFVRDNGSWTQQGEKLVGTGGIAYAYEGYSVAISADGNTAVMGGYYENYGAGAAWIFTRKNGQWEQEGLKLIGTDAWGVAAQGFSVDISGDGNTVIVGGPWDNNEEGAAWIFVRKNGTWVQEGEKLLGYDAIAAYQGRYVALSGDGNTAVVCGPRDNGNMGAVWVFTRNNGVWTQQGDKVTCSDPMGAPYFGRSADLSYDGNTLIVSGTYDNNLTGASWVFTRNNGVWTQQGNKLVGAGAIGNAGQGVSVSISSDGNTAVIGGTADDNNLGATWVFTRQSGVWIQDGEKLVGSGSASGYVYQGVSSAVSGDGNTIIVGGYADNNLDGAVWVFTKNNSEWEQQGQKLLEGDAINNAGFGFSVDLSADGKTFIAGGPWENSNEGAVWVFAVPACDLKENDCISFELMGVTKDLQGARTYEMRVTNACEQTMTYAAFQIPAGLVADVPGNNLIYRSPAQREYQVRNPNFSPFYSLRFQSMNEGIAGGASEIFRYTLPPQADPVYIHAIAKLESGQSYETHLNVFNCNADHQQADRPLNERADLGGYIVLYPNPSSGYVMIDFSEWVGEKVSLQLFNIQGQMVQSEALSTENKVQRINLSPEITDGVYWLQLRTESGKEWKEKIVLQR